MNGKYLDKLRSLKEEKSGSAVGFILGMFILIIISINLLPSLAEQARVASINTSVIAFGGVVAMISILVLMFVILPIIVVAKTL